MKKRRLCHSLIHDVAEAKNKIKNKIRKRAEELHGQKEI